MAANWTKFWGSYERIEIDLCELSHYIEFDDAHLGVYSGRLRDLLLRIGAETENAARAACDDLGINHGNLRNMPAVGQALAAQTKLAGATVDVTWPYQSFATTTMTPLAAWTAGNNPAWFTSYNQVKHNRIQQGHNANVDAVVQGTAGLLVLNVLLRRPDIDGTNAHRGQIGSVIAAYSRFFDVSALLATTGATQVSLRVDL